MLVIKTSEKVQFKTEIASNETTLINNIITTFKNDGYMIEQFKVLNNNPSDNEIFAEIKIIKHMEHVMFNLNGVKEYDINNLFVLQYSLNNYTWQSIGTYTKSFLFYVINNDVEYNIDADNITTDTLTIKNHYELPITTPASNQYITSDGVSSQLTWQHLPQDAIIEVNGTAQEISSDLVDNIVTLSLPSIIHKNNAKFSTHNASSGIIIEMDATNTPITPQIIIGDANFNNSSKITNGSIQTRTPSTSSTMTPTNLIINGGGDTTTITTNSISSTNGIQSCGISAGGAILLNNSRGIEGQIIQSQGASLPSVWSILYETWNGTATWIYGSDPLLSQYAAYTSTVTLNRCGNMVIARFSLPSSTSPIKQSNFPSSVAQLVMSLNPPSSFIPPTSNSYYQNLGNINFSYFTANNQANFTVWSSGNMCVYTGVSDLRFARLTSPTGAEQGTSYIVTNGFWSPYNWSSGALATYFTAETFIYSLV